MVSYPHTPLPTKRDVSLINIALIYLPIFYPHLSPFLEAPLYCLEAPTMNADTEDDGAFVILTWINVYKEGAREETRFGSPYTMQVDRYVV